MKKLLLLSMLGLMGNQLFAQSANGIFKKSKPNKFSTFDAKQTRAANERVVGIEYYSDTAQSTPKPVVLTLKKKLTYSNFRKSSPVVYFNLIVQDMKNDFDKEVTYNYDGFNPDSTTVLNSYDAQNRLIYSASLVFNGVSFDTASYIKSTYTAANAAPDSIANYNNTIVPAALQSLEVNQIVNNKIVSTETYYDSGSGLALVSKINTGYLANGLESYKTSTNSFGSFTYSDSIIYKYTAANLPDSFINYTLNMGTYSLSSVNKFYYNASNSSGFGNSWSSPSNLLEDGIVYTLNADKKITEYTGYSFNSAGDSVFDSKTILEYTPQANLLKLVNKNYTTPTTLATSDSTIYQYETFAPASIHQSSRIITSLTCAPNPVANNANLFYTSSSAKPMQIVLHDVFGKVVYTAQLQSVNGNSFISIPMAQLQTGLYQCTAIVDGQMQASVKIIKE
jgi:Secretion system C-terminal sorting domain